MSDKATNKREWIKTAAIIFLSVMLVLTFFSQTIMNYSLPIVTAQYVSGGQISAKVRGSGTVESADLYNVQIGETRDIQSIEVKKGDTVEKDQVIMKLKDKESDELKKAKEELEGLQVAYKKALLDGGISDFVYYDAVAGKEDSSDGYRSKIKAYNDKIKSINAQLDALNEQKRTGTYNAEVLKLQIDNANAAMTAAKSKLDGIDVTTPSGTYGSQAEAKAAMDNASMALESYRIDRDNAQTSMNNAYGIITKAKQILNAKNTEADFAAWCTANATLISEVNAADTGIFGIANQTDISSTSTADAIQTVINALNGTPSEMGPPTVAATGYYAFTEAYSEKQAAYEEAYKAYSAAASAYNSFGSSSSSQSAKNAAQAEYDNAKATYDNLVAIQANAGLSGADLDNKIAQLEDQKKKADDELTQLLKDIPAEIDLNASAKALKEKTEELEKLLEESVGATIKAPVAGTIVDISVVSGGKAEAGTTIATIQPSDKGFTLKVPITAEQAKKVSVGSEAEVQNSWYFSDIKVELKAIQNDPSNPGKNKLMVFDVSGDVTNGQNLSVSVGSKSASYDLIVPNSAIKEDNNGKYIYIVESKSSPIGNRYYASRVSVEILAEDDTSTAISAPLQGWEYVITAANKPVEAGKQVRLSD